MKNVSDYYVAGRGVPWYLLTGTFVASNVSAGLFLGATNMTAEHGYAMWCSYFTTSFGFLIGIGVVGVLVRRLAENYEIYDYADILATRYASRATTIRRVTAVFLPIVYIPLLAAQLIALSTIAASALGLPYDTVLFGIAVLVIGYTLLGGMLGVVWSDGFQFLVLFFGLILAVPFGMSALGDGNSEQTWSAIGELGDAFRWSTDRWPWQLVVGQLVWMFAIPVQPHLVTRFLTARDERSIIIALPVCMTLGLVIYTATVPLGLLGAMAAPDPGPDGYAYVALADTYLGPWLGAFALAGISAAALSTCSTVLVVTGQLFSREIYQNWIGQKHATHDSLKAARVGVLIVGTLGIVIAYSQFLGIFWLVVLSASLLASVYFVPLMAGFFFRDASADGAVAAMVAGGIVATAVFAFNEAFDANFFVNELFAGLTASVSAMWLMSRKRTSHHAELEAFDCLHQTD